MTLTESEIKELKNQLREQIQHLPPEQRAEAEAQIDSMSNETIEAMLEQERSRQQIFRMIAEKKIEAVIIKENSEAMAVLEIRPISQGHTLIIPKNKVKTKEELPKSIEKFAEEISKLIQLNLKPSKVNTLIISKLGEIIIELIPEYDKPINLESARYMAKKEELEKIAKTIKTETIIKNQKKEETIREEKSNEKSSQVEILKLSRRIP